jgi:hypothetical protein
VVWNVGRKCSSDGFAFACAASTGSILILNSDDQFPCERWDVRLLEALEVRDFDGEDFELRDGAVDDFVIQVSSGTPADDRDLMVLPILSRARYDRMGYALYPGYESVCADDDFSEHARMDGVVIDARHLLFPHLWAGRTAPDEVYAHANREQAYAVGAWMLELRRACNFGLVSFNMSQTSAKRIAFCLPGESFSAPWVWNLVQLENLLAKAGYVVQLFWGETSNVFEARAMLRQEVIQAGPFDYVLMLDDDNLVTFPQVQQMVTELEGHAEISGVTAWTLIQPSVGDAVPIASCGRLSPEGRVIPFTFKELREAQGLMEIEYTGFPCLLLRYQALVDAGKKCFFPIFSDSFTWGMSGEDYAFISRCRKKGMRFFVDPRLCIPHLKTRPIQAPRLDEEPIDLTGLPVLSPDAGPLQKELQTV